MRYILTIQLVATLFCVFCLQASIEQRERISNGIYYPQNMCDKIMYKILGYSKP